MTRYLIGGALTLLLLGLAAIGVSQSGLVNVAATQQDSGPAAWFLHSTYHRSVSRRADENAVPAALETYGAVTQGARNYSAMCSTCHTPPGLGDTPVATGLNPAPPALLEIAEHGTAAEQFWVIKNGVRMTGMPAFGPSHGDDELWALVAFLQTMAGGDAERYRTWITRADQSAPADDGHGHRHGAADADAMKSGDLDHDHDNPSAAEQEQEHDHASSKHGHGPDMGEPHAQEAASFDTPANAAEATASAFYRALATGDAMAVKQLLAPEVLIFESGGVEASFDEYAGHHMPSDMAFLAKATRIPMSRTSAVDGDRAWVASRSRLQATLGDRRIDVFSTETLTMSRTQMGWRIDHVHWSSSPAE